MDPENKLSSEFKELIEAIFSFDGAKRPTLEQISNSPWLKNADSETLLNARKQLRNSGSYSENYMSSGSTATDD